MRNNLKYIFIIILFLGVFVCYSCRDSIDLNLKEPYTIRVTGSEYKWHVLYPGIDQKLDTEDDISDVLPIYLPSNTDVNILLNSDDYLYFFEINAFEQIGMAVPDKTYSLNFNTQDEGNYEIRGNQMCGFTHQSLFGNLEIISAYQFKKREKKI